MQPLAKNYRQKPLTSLAFSSPLFPLTITNHTMPIFTTRQIVVLCFSFSFFFPLSLAFYFLPLVFSLLLPVTFFLLLLRTLSLLALLYVTCGQQAAYLHLNLASQHPRYATVLSLLIIHQILILSPLQSISLISSIFLILLS